MTQKKDGKSKMLLFVESCSELAACGATAGKECRVFGKSTRIVALGPDVQALLKRRRVGFDNALPFFGRRGHEKALAASVEMMRIIREAIDIKDSLDLSQGYKETFAYYLRFFLHGLLYRLEVVDRAVNEIQPHTLAGLCKNGDSEIESLLLGGISLSLLGKRYALAHGIPFETIHGSSEGVSGKRHLPNLKRLGLKLTASLFPLFLASFFRRLAKRDFILAYSNAYGMVHVVRLFTGKLPGSLPIFLKTSAPLKSLQTMAKGKWPWDFLGCRKRPSRRERLRFQDCLEANCLRLASAMAQSQAAFEFNGVDLRPMLLEHANGAVAHLMADMSFETYGIDAILKKAPPLIILSQHALGAAYNLGELARRRRIPALLISHGSHTPTEDPFAKMEWREHATVLMNTTYSHLAVQTPWARKYLEVLPAPHSRTLHTGPLLFGRPVARLENPESHRKRLFQDAAGDFIILHAGTPKSMNTMRFYVYETIDEYIDNINALIKVVDKLEHVHLGVRFRPSPGLATADFKSLLIPSAHCRIYTQGIFSDYLMASDLLVSYSSTTIEEALLNRVPVLQYDPHGKYAHVPGQKLDPKRRPDVAGCYYVGAEAHLGWALSWVINHHVRGKALPASVWRQHAFNDDELEDVVVYFEKQRAMGFQ